MDEEEAKISYEIQYYENQGQEAQRRITQITAMHREIAAAKNALLELEKTGESQTLVPLGAGAFAKASISTKKILVDVGSRVIVEKTPSQAVKILEGRAKTAEESLEQLGKAMAEISNKLQELSMQASQMQKR